LSDFELDERKSNSSSEDSAIFLDNSRRFALWVKVFAFSGPPFVVTKAVLPKSSQSFPELIFGTGETERSVCNIPKCGLRVTPVGLYKTYWFNKTRQKGSGFWFNAYWGWMDGWKRTPQMNGDSRFYEYETYQRLHSREFINHIRQISLDSEVTTHFVNESRTEYCCKRY
jgi:hypothetical protein